MPTAAATTSLRADCLPAWLPGCLPVLLSCGPAVCPTVPPSPLVNLPPALPCSACHFRLTFQKLPGFGSARGVFLAICFPDARYDTHTRTHTGQTLTSHACSYCPVFIVVMSMPTSENMSAVTESSTSTQIRVRVRIQVWSGIWRACHLPVIYSWILSANHCALCINLAQETRRGTPVGHFECSLKSPRIQFDVTLLRFPWGISIELNITWNYDYIIYILSYIIHSLLLHSISRTLFVSNYR